MNVSPLGAFSGTPDNVVEFWGRVFAVVIVGG